MLIPRSYSHPPHIETIQICMMLFLPHACVLVKKSIIPSACVLTCIIGIALLILCFFTPLFLCTAFAFGILFWF